MDVEAEDSVFEARMSVSSELAAHHGRNGLLSVDSAQPPKIFLARLNSC
jgi:hypothetical protein